MRKLFQTTIWVLVLFLLPGVISQVQAAPKAKVEPSVVKESEIPLFTAEGCNPNDTVKFETIPWDNSVPKIPHPDGKANSDGVAQLKDQTLPADTYTLKVTCGTGTASTAFSVTGLVNAEIGGMSADGDGDGTPEMNEDITVEAHGCPSGSVAEFIWDYENGIGSPNRSAKVSENPPGQWFYKTKYSGPNVFIQVYCHKDNKVVDKSPIYQLFLQKNPDAENPEPTLYPTQPPPPPPICAEFDSTGRCAKVNTAIGPICTEAKCFVEAMFVLILSMSGGIALLIIMYAGYVYITSRGNPERLQKAREWLISALIGFLFIIFSLVIMQTITGDLLHIPGFPDAGSTNGTSPCEINPDPANCS